MASPYVRLILRKPETREFAEQYGTRKGRKWVGGAPSMVVLTDERSAVGALNLKQTDLQGLVAFLQKNAR